MCAKVSFTFQEALLPLLPGERRRSAQLWLESNSPCLLPVPLWSESESGGSTSRLSKELHLFPRKWAAQAQLVCGQPVGRNAALPIYLLCCCCTLSLHCTSLCAVLCTAVRQLLCTAGQCFVHGGALLHSVHSARRPAVGSRLAEGSGVHRLLQGSALGGGWEGKVRRGAGRPHHH